ncbi:MAG: PEGA domain-containing protein [Treponema sp.]|jgi:hypothetical protein|nr:PEGA domain-containing protein [Treponema sp.]
MDKNPAALRVFLLFMFFCFLVSAVYSKGDAEEPAAPINGEWVLCITAFDTSPLPAGRRLLGDILARDLAGALEDIDRRYRDGEELDYYRNYAWQKAKTAVAKNLGTKRNERDLLLYQGKAGWEYRKLLKAKEVDIAKLEEELKNLESQGPSVAGEPLFKFADSNKNGAWPAPPKAGGEYRFCTTQKADAFLCGTVSEYHGRVLLSLRMYTLYTRSYAWEDDVIFSSEDLNGAMDELSFRLIAAVSDTLPGAITVRVQPEEAMVLINGVYAGQGETPARTFVPGAAEVEVYAEGYSSAAVNTELNSGELAELYINLSPLSRSVFKVDVPGNEGSSVYLGSLYMGTAPLTLDLPRDQYAYISVETPSGETGSAVYRQGGIVRGKAEFVRPSRDAGETLAFTASVPVSPEEKRVNTARRKFYGAYGRLWVALPLSLLTISIAGNYVDAYNYSVTTGAADAGMYNKAVNSNYFTVGAYAVIGLAAADTVFRIIRYLYTSGADAAPIARFPNQEPVIK